MEDNDKKALVEEKPVEESKEPPAAAEKKPRTYGLKVLVLVAFIAFAAAILGAALLTNIIERKNEARNPFTASSSSTKRRLTRQSGAKIFLCSTTATRKRLTRPERATAAAKRSRIRRPKPTRVRCSPNRGSKKTRA